MKAIAEHAKLSDLIIWIDQNTSNVELPADERSLMAIGCFDIALEHQASIAILHSYKHYGSALALLRPLAESLVRGLWLLQCATEKDLKVFKKDNDDRAFGFSKLIRDIETNTGTPSGVLSAFRAASWSTLCSFTHTGFHQVSRRHSPGKVEENYSEAELAKTLGVAAALGLMAGGLIIHMSGKHELLQSFFERMSAYASTTP